MEIEIQCTLIKIKVKSNLTCNTYTCVQNTIFLQHSRYKLFSALNKKEEEKHNTMFRHCFS